MLLYMSASQKYHINTYCILYTVYCINTVYCTVYCTIVLVYVYCMCTTLQSTSVIRPALTLVEVEIRQLYVKTTRSFAVITGHVFTSFCCHSPMCPGGGL